MPAKSDVLIDVVAGTGWEGYPLTVSASVSGANGVDPTSGSLTLTDETTASSSRVERSGLARCRSRR